MTAFETAMVEALKSVSQELRQARAERVRFEAEIHQKLDTALARHDATVAADLAQTNKRLATVERKGSR